MAFEVGDIVWLKRGEEFAALTHHRDDGAWEMILECRDESCTPTHIHDEGEHYHRRCVREGEFKHRRPMIGDEVQVQPSDPIAVYAGQIGIVTKATFNEHLVVRMTGDLHGVFRVQDLRYRGTPKPVLPPPPVPRVSVWEQLMGDE